MTMKATFCQLPTTCFYWQPCNSSLKLRQTKYTTDDSCDCGVSVLNHCLSWSKFVNTHLYHSRQWFILHIACLLVTPKLPLRPRFEPRLAIALSLSGTVAYSVV